MCVHMCVYVSEHDSVQTVHSIEFKFGMNITVHRRTNHFKFGDSGMIVFFTGVQKRILLHYSVCSNIQMMHSIEIKFCIHIIGHRPTYRVEFREFRMNSFFTGAQKIILIHYSLRSQIVRSMLVSKWCFR